MRTNRARPSLLSARSDGIPQPFEQDESSRFTEPDTLLDDRRPRRLQKKPPYQETPKRSSQSWSRAWLLEILSCITSIVCLVGVVILLKQYDQQPVPALPLGITLNTLLGLLDYYGLSQLKWNWFVRKKRPLVHFEAFDEASRGAVGSIRLLAATRGRISSIQAAAILASSVVTLTSTQAVITSSTRYAPVDGVATVARLPSFQNASLYFIQNGILPPFMEAIFTPVDQTYAHLAATCSTGNCQWLPFNSLAICASMNDVTDQLNRARVI
ncbi:hypothetical protein VTN96DRAFT_9061 [Rasamsonia emersonii]